MAADESRFQNIPGPRQLAEAEPGSGHDNGLGEYGPEKIMDKPPLNYSRENPHERSFLGGIRLRTRMATFIILCLAAFFGSAALFLHSDQKLNIALSKMDDVGEVSSLVAKIESSLLAINSDSRNFLLNKDIRYADNYKKRADILAKELKELHDMPAASDGQKLVATLNDGVTQHGTQFFSVVKIQTLLGMEKGGGLIGNATATASDLQGMFAKLSAGDASGLSSLSGQLAQLRTIETRLQQSANEEDVKNFKAGIAALNKVIGETALTDGQKKALSNIAKSYQADVEQFSRTQGALAKEIERLGEINSYLSPNLDSLINFAGNLSQSARFDAKGIQMEIRRLLAGGGGGILLIYMVVGYLLMRSVTKPVKEIASAARKLAHGDNTVSIPVLGNYDETGELAETLTFFRENMAQSDRLRKELETQLKLKDQLAEQLSAKTAASTPTDTEETPVLDDQPPPAAKPEEETQELISHISGEPAIGAAEGASPITAISQLVTQTSQEASIAASEAERTETMVTGLEEAADKIEDIEALMIGISDQMSLLAVQTALLDEVDDPENLILLDEKRKDGEQKKSKLKPGAGQSVGDRVETIQNGAKRAVKSIQQIGRTINDVNQVAKEFAADSSREALQAANELLRQSEDLKGMLDSLLGKVQPSDQTLPDLSHPARIADQSGKKSELDSEG